MSELNNESKKGAYTQDLEKNVHFKTKKLEKGKTKDMDNEVKSEK